MSDALHAERAERALEWLAGNFEGRVEELIRLSRIASVSAAGFPELELQRSAQAVSALLEASGFERGSRSANSTTMKAPPRRLIRRCGIHWRE